MKPGLRERLAETQGTRFELLRHFLPRSRQRSHLIIRRRNRNAGVKLDDPGLRSVLQVSEAVRAQRHGPVRGTGAVGPECAGRDGDVSHAVAGCRIVAIAVFFPARLPGSGGVPRQFGRPVYREVLSAVRGLTTEEIARAYLTRPVTIAQRIVRAKAKISENRIPYVVPDRAELPARLGSALHVLYLIFTEGYAATAGQSLTRPDFCVEAIRLTKLITGLLDDSEAFGLFGADADSRITPCVACRPRWRHHPA
jgi:hypothetical protein